VRVDGERLDGLAVMTEYHPSVQQTLIYLLGG